ncbi:MAG: hypothetical protein OXF79_14950 [Chloroflexi bacterium]|nr:hypothetical protein [Chloroflexota bacterium]
MIYMLVCKDPKSRLPEVVDQAAKDIFQLGEQAVWFIDIDCTSSELLDMIWPDDEEDASSAGVGVLLDVEGYRGYAPTAFWKWMKAHRK